MCLNQNWIGGCNEIINEEITNGIYNITGTGLYCIPYTFY